MTRKKTAAKHPISSNNGDNDQTEQTECKNKLVNHYKIKSQKKIAINGGKFNFTSAQSSTNVLICYLSISSDSNSKEDHEENWKLN